MMETKLNWDEVEKNIDNLIENNEFLLDDGDFIINTFNYLYDNDIMGEYRRKMELYNDFIIMLIEHNQYKLANKVVTLQNTEYKLARNYFMLSEDNDSLIFLDQMKELYVERVNDIILNNFL